MARLVGNNVFLEEWLKSNSSSGDSTVTATQTSSARAIIQAWAELRDCVQSHSFESHHLQSLNTLCHSRTSLHVADPQAKLLLSILPSPTLVLPPPAYPLLFHLIYIWVRKSSRPLPGLVDSAAKDVTGFLATELDSKRSPELFSEGILLLGAFSVAISSAESSKRVCLELLCRLLEESYRLVGRFDDLIANVLAGMGYALCSAVTYYFPVILDNLFKIWGKEGGPRGSVANGLMILHLVEWVSSGFIQSLSQEKLQIFSEVFEITKANYLPFALIMAAAGALRALNRSVPSGQGCQILSRLRISAENRITSLANDLNSRIGGISNSHNDCDSSLLLQCISLALARAGSVSARPPLLISLASALLTEIFPLCRLYDRILDTSYDGSTTEARFHDIKGHLNSLLLEEAGAISGVFCSQYAAVDEGTKITVENRIWRFCQELYSGHRMVAVILRSKDDGLLADMDKITESAFLMVVVFALAVTKNQLNLKPLTEAQMETSVSVLISFSCVEYFRRVRLTEYMDTIRVVAVSVQERESACVSFIESMPSYLDLTNPQEFRQKVEYAWFKDEVQTARILFYLRVIPTCIERLPAPLFSRVVAPIMFLYMEHPNGKVARASHSVFASFVSSGNDSNENERTSLKEQLAFHYVQKSLTVYPDVTPFEGMASGIVALVRNLPAGSPATFHCVHSLVEKAKKLCSLSSTEESDLWKNWQGESGPCKKFLELLLRLIFLVDIQVLPYLMKLMADLIIHLPKDGQNVILDALYTQVAESDDVVRKPALVSWLQSLTYICSQATNNNAASTRTRTKETSAASQTDSSSWERMNARL